MVGLPSSTYVAALLVFAAVALGTLFLVLVWEWLRERRNRKDVAAKLDRIVGGAAASPAASALMRPAEGTGPAWVQPLTRRFSHLKDVELLIEQGALNWSIQTYLLFTGGFAVAFGVAALIATRSLLFALIAAGIGAVLPYMYVKRRRTKRVELFEMQLPEAVDLLGRAIRAGHPLSSGFKMVAEESPEPVAGEFRRVFEEQRFGLPFQESLLGMADRIPLVDVRIFVTAVLVQRDVGGNLAEILDKLSYVIRERFSILRQLRVFTAQGRLSGYILAALPIGLGFVLFLINRDNMIAFVQAPLGRVLLTVAVVMQLIGFFWISKVVKIEV